MIKIIPLPSPTPILPTMPPVTATPTLPASAPAPLGEIRVGDYVQVTGTGGAGLRVRSQPSLQASLVFLAIEAEVLRVTDGPRQADGYTWWHLVAPYDDKLQGWAVADFLATIQTP